MSSMWGNRFKISIFGESHGKAIGIVIDGLPAGKKLDFEKINLQMKRRKPGNENSTSRNESDEIDIVSGIFKGVTTGAPLCAFIKNKDVISKDYNEFLPRPGHADYTSHIRYKGFEDFRGGGHFSGRLTAPMVFAGAICKQILAERNIFVGSHVSSVGDINDQSFDFKNISSEFLIHLSKERFPVIDSKIKNKMKEKIKEIKLRKDSIGGTIECAVLGLKAGIGNPIFENIESKISSLIFAIPAVKAIEFGNGFNSSQLKGSENNDEFLLENGLVKTKTNNHGGILGGISSGMPIIFKTAFKPTPSIGISQKTVNLKENSECKILVKGRHDPCIVSRVAAVVESAAAIAILDFLI